MLADKRAILQCLGCIIQCPALLEEYRLEEEDFDVEPFYLIIFSCIYNLYNQGVNTIDCFAIDSMLSRYAKQYKIFEDNNGIDYCNDAVSLAELDNFTYYYERLKKFSYLRFLEARGVDSRILYDSTIVEPSQQEKEMEKLDNTTIDEMIEIIDCHITTEAKMKYSSNSISRGQLAGKGMKDLKERLKQAPEFGIPLQSPIMTTIFRGARKKKIYMRSASSGGGRLKQMNWRR